MYKTIFNLMKLIFSPIEKKDILKAWLAISLAFAILYTRNINNLLPNFLMSIFTVGIGFLLHELAHKYIAQKYRCFAEFRADNKMLLIAIATAFLGFIFAAPGGVMIQGYVDKKRYAQIAAAGPLMNILIAIVFLWLSFVSGFELISSFGFAINSWLALFNLIPIFPFDGSKIIAGNKFLYFSLVIASVILLILSFR